MLQVEELTREGAEAQFCNPRSQGRPASEACIAVGCERFNHIPNLKGPFCSRGDSKGTEEHDLI